MRHGMHIWDATDNIPGFRDRVRAGMGSDSGTIVKVIVEDCGEVFQRVSSVIDVAGGVGTIALAIKETFPEIECKMLDLPHMVAALEKTDLVEYVPLISASLTPYMLTANPSPSRHSPLHSPSLHAHSKNSNI